MAKDYELGIIPKGIRWDGIRYYLGRAHGGTLTPSIVEYGQSWRLSVRSRDRLMQDELYFLKGFVLGYVSREVELCKSGH